MSLPQVSIDIVSSTTASMDDNKDFWQDITEQIFKENILLYQLLAVADKAEKEQQFKEGYKRGACLIYSLLARQVEADEMNAAWGLDDGDEEERSMIKCSCGSSNWTLNWKSLTNRADDKFNCKDCGLIFKREGNNG